MWTVRDGYLLLTLGTARPPRTLTGPRGPTAEPHLAVRGPPDSVVAVEESQLTGDPHAAQHASHVTGPAAPAISPSTGHPSPPLNPQPLQGRGRAHHCPGRLARPPAPAGLDPSPERLSGPRRTTTTTAAGLPRSAHLTLLGSGMVPRQRYLQGSLINCPSCSLTHTL